MLPANKEKITIDIEEVCRYLGYGNSRPEEDVSIMIGDCMDDVYRSAQLRSVCRRFPVAFPTEDTVRIGAMDIKSSTLSRALEGCTEAMVFGATVGMGIDSLIAKATVNNITRSAIYQAVGAAYIEAYCDLINDDIDTRIRLEGKHTRRRFSPGYGDFSIDCQRGLFDLLDLTRQTGICLTSGMAMTPSKSVTAIVGISCDGAGDPSGTYEKKCETCTKTDCPYRSI